MMHTIALSGPEAKRAAVEVALEDARIPVYPSDHWAPMNWAAKFPDDTDAWLTVEHEDPNVPHAVVEHFGWRLRVHYETPEKPQPSPEQALTATVAEMRAEIDALKARAGQPLS